MTGQISISHVNFLSTFLEVMKYTPFLLALLFPAVVQWCEGDVPL
jgi:hypothetical protein